jgi:hypothetical protein
MTAHPPARAWAAADPPELSAASVAASALSSQAPALPPDPEDDESGRGPPRFGPALLAGLLAWAVLLLLLVL